MKINLEEAFMLLIYFSATSSEKMESITCDGNWKADIQSNIQGDILRHSRWVFKSLD